MAAAKRGTKSKSRSGQAASKRASSGAKGRAAAPKNRPATQKATGKAKTKKAAGKAGAAKRPARKAAAKTAKKAVAKLSKVGKAVKARAKQSFAEADRQLFEPLTEGERADALRVLTEDRRLANMAKVARYRVIAVEPLALKSPHPRAHHRLARVVIYDYAANKSVEALVDLDESTVAHLQLTDSQPGLGSEEEAAAQAIALADQRVSGALGLSDEPLATMHYWSRRETELPFGRRSAAVLFGPPEGRPSIIAVVDLNDGEVIEVVPAEQW